MKRYEIPDAVSVCGGKCQNIWYAGVLVLEDVDRGIRPASGKDGRPESFDGRVGLCRRWQRRAVNPPRRILLARPRDGALSTECLAAGERLDGPVCPKEPVPGPILAWTERREGAWELRLYADGETHTVFRQRGILRSPHLAMTSEGVVLAWSFAIFERQMACIH